MNGTHKNERRDEMKITTIARTSMILAAFGILFLMPVTCHAQAEVNPDCYALDGTTDATPALAQAQPASAELAPASELAAMVDSRVSAVGGQRLALINYGSLIPSAVMLNIEKALSRVHTVAADYLHQVWIFMNHDDQPEMVAARYSAPATRVLIS
jgi:hypothetical protein